VNVLPSEVVVVVCTLSCSPTSPILFRVRVRVGVWVLWDVETSPPRREEALRYLLGQGVDGTWNREEGT
jgi:hypothetical protein